MRLAGPPPPLFAFLVIKIHKRHNNNDNTKQIDADSLVNHTGERRERELGGEGEEEEGDEGARAQAHAQAVVERQRWVIWVLSWHMLGYVYIPTFS